MLRDYNDCTFNEYRIHDAFMQEFSGVPTANYQNITEKVDLCVSNLFIEKFGNQEQFNKAIANVDYIDNSQKMRAIHLVDKHYRIYEFKLAIGAPNFLNSQSTLSLTAAYRRYCNNLITKEELFQIIDLFNIPLAKKDIAKEFVNSKLPALEQQLPLSFVEVSAVPTEEPKVSLEEMMGNVLPIAGNFTTIKTIEEQRLAHESAKEFLRCGLERLGATVDFISHQAVDSPSLNEIIINPGLLDPTVFQAQYTTGVLDDIKRDGNRIKDKVVVYGAASQFNGCEAPDKYTISPNNAVKTYQTDRTQGPQSQLAFSAQQVELINCGGNLGYNGLCNTLDEDTKDQVRHGYFTPTQEKAENIITLLRNNGHKIEYPCVANVPLDGQKEVHLILVAAPAFGEYAQVNSAKGEHRNEIQFLCALHSFRAQFEKCVALGEKTSLPVEFKATAVGLGVFGNHPEVIAKAFYQAALEYQASMKANQVTVQFQIFNLGIPNRMASRMANQLGLQVI